MEITLGQQYNVGEKPTVILYTYINRHAGTPENCCINSTDITLAASVVQVQCTEFLCDVHNTNSNTVLHSQTYNIPVQNEATTRW